MTFTITTFDLFDFVRFFYDKVQLKTDFFENTEPKNLEEKLQIRKFIDTKVLSDHLFNPKKILSNKRQQ